jgi:hypothetical protein
LLRRAEAAILLLKSRDFAWREKNQWPLAAYRGMCLAERLHVSNCPDIISTSELGIIWERRFRAQEERISIAHRSISSPSASEQKYIAIGFYISLLMAKFWVVDNYYFIRCGFLLFSFLLCLCVIFLLLESNIFIGDSGPHRRGFKGKFIL